MTESTVYDGRARRLLYMMRSTRGLRWSASCPSMERRDEVFVDSMAGSFEDVLLLAGPGPA